MKNPYCYKYPRPAVTADCVVLAWEGGEMKVLLIERGNEPYRGKWALPGGFMNMDETAEECAVRELKEETGLEVTFVRQIGAFTEVGRDPRGRTVSIAFYAIIDRVQPLAAGDDAAGACWFSFKELPALAFDHEEIVKQAIKRFERLLGQVYLSVPDIQDDYQPGEWSYYQQCCTSFSADRMK